MAPANARTPPKLVQFSAATRNEAAAAWLWAVSEELTGVTFEALTLNWHFPLRVTAPSSGTARTADRHIQGAGTLTTN